MTSLTSREPVVTSREPEKSHGDKSGLYAGWGINMTCRKFVTTALPSRICACCDRIPSWFPHVIIPFLLVHEIYAAEFVRIYIYGSFAREQYVVKLCLDIQIK